MVTAAAWLAAVAAVAPCPANEASKERDGERFVRLARDSRGKPLALESAIVRFVPTTVQEGGPTVDLVAAVHVAEKSYYRRLNQLFKGYDAVLYEMVAPAGVDLAERIPADSSHPVSLLQRGMTRVLELEFQLNGIDYSARNFVHADMTAEQFAETMRQRGESMLQIFFRMFWHALAEQAGTTGDTDVRLLMALFSRDRALALKRVLAEQVEDMEGSLQAIEGPKGSTLISERNKVALEVLRKRLASGDRRVAIFFGAAHMPDLARRLRKGFQLKPSTTRWLVAWELTGKKAPPGD
ncbi:MAG TPA: hypothetical protein EYP56_12190 [Planctomycetaceae bacterium]|nr:hypothetical protein [Planctomycetaceae bacterium]